MTDGNKEDVQDMELNGKRRGRDKIEIDEKSQPGLKVPFFLKSAALNCLRQLTPQRLAD